MFEELDAAERRGLRGALLVCLVIFFADASHSMPIPIFPSFAQGLGASLPMIGVFAAASSLAMIFLSVPIGSLSDRIGRRGVMMMGYALMVVVPIMYTFSTAAEHLLPARLLLGVAMGSTFSIGFVYVSELAPASRRNLVQGVYMTTMGLGFTAGPLLGGLTSSAWGYYVAFYVSGGLAAVGLVLLLFVPGGARGGPSHAEGSRRSGLREVLADTRILAAGVSNFVNSLMFSSLSTFFPLLGGFMGLNEAEVGLGFTVRGLSSTVIRFPTGAYARRVGVLRLMALGLALSASMLLLVTFTDQLLLVCLLLGVQGLAYGVYLTSGNIYVTQEAPPDRRGAAIGTFSTFGNVSGVLSPLLLGVVAEGWGLRAVFQLSAVLSMAGVCLVLLLVKKGEKGAGAVSLTGT
jgi:MFS family permease